MYVLWTGLLYSYYHWDLYRTPLDTAAPQSLLHDQQGHQSAQNLQQIISNNFHTTSHHTQHLTTVNKNSTDTSTYRSMHLLQPPPLLYQLYNVWLSCRTKLRTSAQPYVHHLCTHYLPHPLLELSLRQCDNRFRWATIAQCPLEVIVEAWWVIRFYCM
jgi:hypothetical protein